MTQPPNSNATDEEREKLVGLLAPYFTHRGWQIAVACDILAAGFRLAAVEDMPMLIDNNWLRRGIATDRDLDCEVGLAVSPVVHHHPDNDKSIPALDELALAGARKLQGYDGPPRPWVDPDVAANARDAAQDTAASGRERLRPGLEAALAMLEHPNAGMEPPDGGDPSEADRVRNVAADIRAVLAGPSLSPPASTPADLNQARAQGMEAAANICASLAETDYADGRDFEVALACEAVIRAAIQRQFGQEGE